MSTQPVDYGALAQQARQPAAVDYSSLAAQARAPIPEKTEQKASGFADQLKSAASNFWNQVNPAKLAQGVTDTALHLGDAAKAYGAKNDELLKKAEDAYKSGDYTGAVSHGLNYLLNGVPGIGSTLDEAGEQAKAGDIGGSLGKTAGLATLLIGTPKVPAMAGAAADAASSATDFASKVASHPKVVSALKDAAVELAKEVPGVKTAIKTAKVASAAKDVIDDIRHTQASSEIPEAAPAADVPREATASQIAQKPAAEVMATKVPFSASTKPIPSSPLLRDPDEYPPTAFADTETTGVQIAREQNARTAIASKIADWAQQKGVTGDALRALKKSDPAAYDLFWKHSEISDLSSQSHYSPSPATQERVLAELDTRKPATPAPMTAQEFSQLSPLARNPKALKIAQQLADEMAK